MNHLNFKVRLSHDYPKLYDLYNGFDLNCQVHRFADAVNYNMEHRRNHPGLKFSELWEHIKENEKMHGLWLL